MPERENMEQMHQNLAEQENSSESIEALINETKDELRNLEERMARLKEEKMANRETDWLYRRGDEEVTLELKEKRFTEEAEKFKELEQAEEQYLAMVEAAQKILYEARRNAYPDREEEPFKPQFFPDETYLCTDQ